MFGQSASPVCSIACCCRDGKREKLSLYDRIDELKRKGAEKNTIINFVKSWKAADYNKKKAVAMIMIDKIIISEDGSTKIIWNI